jgi:hypothetical protein
MAAEAAANGKEIMKLSGLKPEVPFDCRRNPPKQKTMKCNGYGRRNQRIHPRA